MKPLSARGHYDGEDNDINIHILDDANSSLGEHDYYSDIEQRYPYSLPNGYGSSLRQPTTTISEDGSAGTARSGGRLSGTAHYYDPHQNNQCENTTNKWNSFSGITKTSIARSGAMDDSDVGKECCENLQLIAARPGGSTSKSEVEVSMDSPTLLDHSLARDDHNVNGVCDEDTSDIKSVNSSLAMTRSSTPNTSTLSSQKDQPETSPTNTTSSSGTNPPSAGEPLGIAQPLSNALLMTVSEHKTEIVDTDSAIIGGPMTMDAAPLNLMETERLANEPNVAGFQWMGMGGGVPLLVPIQRTLDGSRTYDGSIPTYTNRTDVEDAGATISKDDGSLEIIYPHSHYIANVGGGTDELYASQAIQLAINRGNSMADKAEPSIEDGRSIDDGSTISSSHKLPGFLHFYDHNNRVANEATKSGGFSESTPPKRPKRLMMFAVIALLVVVLAVIVGATACGLTVCQDQKGAEVLESPEGNKEENDVVPARTLPPSPSTAVPTGRSDLGDGGDADGAEGVGSPSLEPSNKATSSPRGDTNDDPGEAADPDEAEPTPSPLRPSATATTSAPQTPTPTQPVGEAGTRGDTTSKPAMSPVDDKRSPEAEANKNEKPQPTAKSPNDDTMMSPSPSPDNTPTSDNETDDSETGGNNNDGDPESNATETPVPSPVDTFKPTRIRAREPPPEPMDPPTDPPEESLTDRPMPRPTGVPFTVETNDPEESQTVEPAEDATPTEPTA